MRSGGWLPRAWRRARPYRRWPSATASNANLLFTWRRRGARSAASGGLGPLKLLPVTVADEGMAAAPIAPSAPAGRMEIALVGGERVVVGADVDAAALARVVKALSRR
jgi:transposase